MKTLKKTIVLILAALILLGTGAPAVFAEDDHPTWGTWNVITAPDGGSYTYYVDMDGTFSTEIREDGITWLKIEFNDIDADGIPIPVSFWVGLSNPETPYHEPLFRSGERFCITVKERFSPSFLKDYNLLDPIVRRTSDIFSFLDIRVIREDGLTYSVLDTPCELFLRQDQDESEAVRGFLLSDDPDEPSEVHVTWLPLAGIPCPEEGVYTVFRLTHLDATLALSGGSANGSAGNTGSTISESTRLSVAVVSFGAGAAVTAVVLLILFRKKDSRPE